MKLLPVYNVSDIKSDKENIFTAPPDVIVPDEKNLDEFAAWNYANTLYGATYYNLPINYLGLASAPGYGIDMHYGQAGATSYERSPVYFMYRMITYFLGKQNNTDYSWMSPINGENITLQPGWINGEEISLFVDLFQGIFRNMISSAKFSANPLSKELNEQKQLLYNMMLMVVKHKDAFKNMAANGFQFSPADMAGIEDKDDLDNFFAETYVDEGADICTIMSNGIWHTNYWMQMFMSIFTHIVICGKGAVEHDMINGLARQREIQPYWLIHDIRVPDGDDYNEFGQHIGYYKPFQYNNIYQYDNLKKDQIERIRGFCTSGNYNNTMGILPNGMNWAMWNTNKRVNETFMLRMYYKGRKYVSYDEATNATKSGDKVSKDDNGNYVEDIYGSDIIAGTFMARWGKTRNKINKYGNKRNMEFPIQMFQPNTFLGTSVSKVGRVFKIADEIDMYRYKVRDAVGKSKGKVVFIFGDKAMSSIQDIAKDLTEMGAHVMIKDKFDDNPNNRQNLIETVDWGATDDVNKVYMPMIAALKANMKEILSVSDTLMGQQASYSGAATGENIVTGNSFGMSYIMNGTLAFITRNMRYALKQQINYNTVKEKVELEYSIGQKGLEFIDWMKVNSIDWDDIGVWVETNDQLDSAKRKQISDFLFNASQNGQYTSATLETLISLIKITNEDSVTASIEDLKKTVRRLKKEEAKKEQSQAEGQQQAQQAQIASTEKIAAGTMAAKESNDLQNIDRKGLWNLMDAYVAAKNGAEQQVIQGMIDKELATHDASLQPQEPPQPQGAPTS